MRKIIVCLLILNALAPAKTIAQLKDNLSLGPVIGFGHSWNSIDYGSAVKKFNPSVMGGLRLTYSVIPHFGVALDASFKTEGYKLANTGFKFVTHLNYINLDPKAWFFFGKQGKAIRPKIGIGPNFGFLVGGKRKEDVLYGQAGVTNSKDYYKSFNFGLAGAVGLNYRLKSKTWLNVDAVYNHGLSDIVKNSFGSLHTRNLFLNVGVTFGIGQAGKK